jgi:hypothetical protein
MRPPKPSPAALAAKPVAFTRRDQITAVLSTSITHLQLVITRGWARDEHFAWLISDGTNVLSVYHITASNQLGDVIGAVVNTVYPTVGTPLERASFGVMGSIHAPPPPPPPEPGGFPQIYVEQVLTAAWRMNQEQVRLATPAAGGQILTLH